MIKIVTHSGRQKTVELKKKKSNKKSPITVACDELVLVSSRGLSLVFISVHR